MKKAYLYAGISILFWSTIATVSKLLLNTLNSYQVLMFSAFFAGVALLIVNIFTGKIKLLKNYKLKDYVTILLICSPGTFFYYVFLYSGTAKMEASQAFIINYLWPIMSVVFACIILKEKLTARKCVAFLLSFIGVLTVAGNELLNFNSQTLIGFVLCVLAAVSYGAFTALNRKWDYDYQLSMMLSFFCSFLLTVVINVIMGKPLNVGIPQILGFAWSGFFVMATATVTWALALKYGGTAKISNLAYITPFLSLVWTFLVLKEPIKPLSVIGLVIIITGILIQLKDPKNQKQ
ncbi:MAG: DMT family transporter [Ruminococcaceae bacterium]|nr:DMT family transporter [Oscillospiraceae bacterium]